MPDIRAQAIDYFKTKGIVWQQGHGDKTINHMCSSQVCCVNFLSPFAQASEECLVELLRPIYPTIKSIVPMDDMNLTFEWIGQEINWGKKYGVNEPGEPTLPVPMLQ